MRWRRVLFVVALSLATPVIAPVPEASAQLRITVGRPPPQVRREQRRPPRPHPDAVWVRGHWSWNGRDYVWRRGHWEMPRDGYVYEQPRWEREGTRWVFINGRWIRARDPYAYRDDRRWDRDRERELRRLERDRERELRRLERDRERARSRHA